MPIANAGASPVPVCPSHAAQLVHRAAAWVSGIFIKNIIAYIEKSKSGLHKRAFCPSARLGFFLRHVVLTLRRPARSPRVHAVHEGDREPVGRRDTGPGAHLCCCPRHSPPGPDTSPANRHTPPSAPSRRRYRRSCRRPPTRRPGQRLAGRAGQQLHRQMTMWRTTGWWTSNPAAAARRWASSSSAWPPWPASWAPSS